MSAQIDLVETAKRALKARGLTYRDVAGALALSEASVKRMFSRRDFTLERLERVCALADLSIADLVRLAESERPEVSELSLEQERELVADDKLLMLAVQVVNGWRFEELMDVFAFTEPELIGYLVKLDRLGIIELLPRNRIRLRISRRFRWQKNGPIERSLARQVRENFLESRFDLSDESMGFVFGILST